jgi:CelD/BcsL family acetyltransferase involved in cellulose biosynthesis
MLDVQAITQKDWAAVLCPEWLDLQNDSDTATPFQTWEWVTTWHRHFGGRPVILTIRREDRLIGLFPLVRKTHAWTTLRPMGTGPSDYLHPLMRTGVEHDVWDAISSWLFDGRPASVVDLHQFSERQDLIPEDEQTVANATCLVVDLPDSYEAYLQRLSKSLRYDVRKLDKKLFQEGNARIYEPDDLADGLDILFEQHRKRWRSRGLPGAFAGRMERFHRDWAALARQREWLRLRVLEIDGKPIGAIYAMTFNGVCYYYQAGFDPAYSSLSPGSLLVAHTIREAIEEGVKQFDFCRGDEPYKRRWQPDHVFTNQRLIHATGKRGRIGLAYLLKAWSVEEKVRARLEGGSLFGKERQSRQT